MCAWNIDFCKWLSNTDGIRGRTSVCKCYVSPAMEARFPGIENISTQLHVVQGARPGPSTTTYPHYGPYAVSTNRGPPLEYVRSYWKVFRSFNIMWTKFCRKRTNCTREWVYCIICAGSRINAIYVGTNCCSDL